MKDYEKWNNYRIGKVKFINKNRCHPHRQIFIDFVLKNCSSVVEIGAGELIEYQEIIKSKKDIKYTIVDVSDLFIENCKKKYPNIETIQSPIEDLTPKFMDFDVVYAASVLEHLKDIALGIKNMISLAANFHFVLFKWNYSGNLVSEFSPEKKYWSSSFNIYMLLKEIENFGTITNKIVACKTGKLVSFDEYSFGRSGPHRNGDYLVIQGNRV